MVTMVTMITMVTMAVVIIVAGGRLSREAIGYRLSARRADRLRQGGGRYLAIWRFGDLVICVPARLKPAAPRFVRLSAFGLDGVSSRATHSALGIRCTTTAAADSDARLGRTPRGVINREVLERPGFQEKWARLRIG